MSHDNLQIVFILTAGFSLASLLGYLAQRFKLPTIFGYLLAGYLIGPFSPGYVADLTTAEQLAEVGVILMLFGVGIHFKLQDLNKVKSIAIPGAIGQTFISSLLGFFLIYYAGWSLSSAIVIGLAISVASTVVLVHVLTSKNLLETKGGHIAIGWLVVEDMFTVAILILMPMLVTYIQEGGLSIGETVTTVAMMLAKFIILTLALFLPGQKIIERTLNAVARLRSNELLTLTVLAIAFVIATTSTLVFGMSVALGAFLAGMVIGQTHIRHQAEAVLLPLKDTFAVIFFLSVGMLFDPKIMVNSFALFIGTLTIIVLIKPLIAFFIAKLFKQSLRSALTIAISLGQIGEFSFILAEEALNYKLLPDEGYDLLVACALISISINPLLLNGLDYFERFLRPYFSKATSLSSQNVNEHLLHTHLEGSQSAILVGLGSVGCSILQSFASSKNIVVIEQNIDLVLNANKEYETIFGDASHGSILLKANIEQADLLIITTTHISSLVSIIRAAKELKPTIRIIARNVLMSEKKLLDELEVDSICDEKEVLNQFINRVQTSFNPPINPAI